MASGSQDWYQKIGKGTINTIDSVSALGSLIGFNRQRGTIRQITRTIATGVGSGIGSGYCDLTLSGKINIYFLKIRVSGDDLTRSDWRFGVKIDSQTEWEDTYFSTLIKGISVGDPTGKVIFTENDTTNFKRTAIYLIPFSCASSIRFRVLHDVDTSLNASVDITLVYGIESGGQITTSNGYYNFSTSAGDNETYSSIAL